MDPILLSDIENVEQKYGSLSNPFADLTNIHKRAKYLGLFGNQYRRHKNKMWLVNNHVYLTLNPKILKIYYLLLNHSKTRYIRKKIHVDGGLIGQIRNIIKLHRQIKLVDEKSLVSIEG